MAIELQYMGHVKQNMLYKCQFRQVLPVKNMDPFKLYSTNFTILYKNSILGTSSNTMLYDALKFVRCMCQQFIDFITFQKL
jgi:hypothetical protein